jgi:uncharacterized membrane protein
MKNFIKATLIGGLLFLLPLVLVVMLGAKAFAVIRSVTDPIADLLNLHRLLGVYASHLLAWIVLTLLCFIAGLFARTTVARSFMRWLETWVLSMLPGYRLMATLTGDANLTRDRGEAKPEAVLARIEDAWQFALVVERIGATHVVVYVPGAPSATSGSVYVMDVDRVRPVNAPLSEVMKSLKGLGVGTAALLGERGAPDFAAPVERAG